MVRGEIPMVSFNIRLTNSTRFIRSALGSERGGVTERRRAGSRQCCCWVRCCRSGCCGLRCCLDGQCKDSKACCCRQPPAPGWQRLVPQSYMLHGGRSPMFLPSPPNNRGRGNRSSFRPAPPSSPAARWHHRQTSSPCRPPGSR